MRFFSVSSSLLLHAVTTTQTLGLLFHSKSNGWTTRSSRLMPSRPQASLPLSSIAITRRRRRGSSEQRQGLPKLHLNRGQELVSKDSTDTFPRGRFPLPFNRTGNGISSNNVVQERDEQMSPRFFPDYFGQERNIRKLSDFDSNTANTTQDYDMKLVLAMLTAATAFALVARFSVSSDFSPSTISATAGAAIATAREVMNDPGGALDSVVQLTDSMGPLGIAYFGVAYCVAEILAIPAIPLTASAGYLFGPARGTAIVLLSASAAAAVSFSIGRTLLRDYVEGVLEEYPKFSKLDKAIGREGFKLMLLLRLSPVFPFALSNYLYGATSISFPAFFGGTLLGFAPGTIAYVYTGYIGKALTGDAGASDVYPWYVYLGGLAVFAGFLKIVADTATRVIEEIEAEEEEENVLF